MDTVAFWDNVEPRDSDNLNLIEGKIRCNDKPVWEILAGIWVQFRFWTVSQL
jgi:hypothetical protein